jgi:aryl-alcohol dehydrogenase-like predicted oxidoreductase
MMTGMEQRSLGSTALPVTRIGLGLAALGRPAYITTGRADDIGPGRAASDMERRCHDVLDAAYAAGVRYFDAARSYGLAEAFLSSWFARRRLPLEAATVGSKWGYTYIGGWRLDAPVHEQKDLSVATLQRQFRESRSHLGDRLRLYEIHSATLESGVLDDRTVLAELARMRSSGVVIGLTVSGPRQAEVIRRSLEVTVDGENPFCVVQATWNLLEPSCGAALADAHREGWGIIVKEALANGRLVIGPDQTNRHVQTVAASLAASADQIAIAAALSQPWAHVVLSGAVTAEQVRSNVAAIDIALSPEHQAALSTLAESPETYWARRASTKWT